MYKLLFSAVFGRLPAETAHRLGFGLIRWAAAVPGVSWLLLRWLAPGDPVLRVQAFGRDLPGPLGLAAGFDKDALGPDALGMLGFAFVEVGTVTAQPQPGNPKPRMFRLPRDRALINRMGFNNHGAAAAAARLRSRRTRSLMVGANIGKTKAVPESEAAERLRGERAAARRRRRLPGHQRQLSQHPRTAQPAGRHPSAPAGHRRPGGPGDHGHAAHSAAGQDRP